MSTYTFGWWDYADGDQPAMVCRFTVERIVRVGPLADEDKARAITAHPAKPADAWLRFEYRHAEYSFPLAVNWRPDEGEILVDYNISAVMWRRETNAEAEHPPYGGWTRVDDMVPDAFWCWPGNMTLLLATARAGITASGGWSNGVWRPDFQQRDHVGPRLAASMIYAGGVGVALGTELDPEGGEYLQEITEAELEQRTQGCAVSARIFDDPISAGPRSPWRFDIDLPANWRLPARLKGLESLHRDTLQGGYVPRMVSDDFDRLLTAAGGRDEFDFHYCSPDLVWHIVLSEWPVIDWPGGRGFHFSHKHCASTSMWVRHYFARPALSLAEADRLFRDVADAFLGWRGTLETPTIWDSYGDEAYSHKPRKYLQPVETMSGIYSQIAGIRCARRAKTFSYAVAR